MFDDLQPFSIVINNGKDAAWISSAMLQWMSGGDRKRAEDAMSLMYEASARLGAEEGVRSFFNEGKKQGKDFPKFLQPVITHMMKHVIGKEKSNGAK